MSYPPQPPQGGQPGDPYGRQGAGHPPSGPYPGVQQQGGFGGPPPPGAFGGPPQGGFGGPPPQGPPRKKSRAGLVIGLVIGAVVLVAAVIGGVAVWFMTSNADANGGAGFQGGRPASAFPRSYDSMWFDDAPFTVAGMEGSGMGARTEPGGSSGSLSMDFDGGSVVCSWTLQVAEADGNLYRADATPDGENEGCPQIGSITFQDYSGSGIHIYVGPAPGQETDYIDSY
ncbi:hypothetical protein [Allonocardiopsis opalescens]|uniref:Uncharacterized protein n=1 Tax=Allonocardiopsis opalescens TaxID=1144618 RepID=A0A2T0PU52_9ACTN|nr:hypothetical protein [Allonocardiopsis opalescens]PRX92429.1 hypothetical protein CLV72_110189 [Allonocardiopsis opalescens]